MSSFVVIASRGLVRWGGQSWPYTSIATKTPAHNPEGYGKAWRVLGEDVLPIYHDPIWYVILDDSVLRQALGAHTRFDTVEEAVMYCNLMDNT